MEQRICVGAFVIQEDKLLLVNHKKAGRFDFWVAPGGQVKGTESMEAAVIREVKEETGLDITVNKLMYVEEMYFPNVRSIKFWYHCELVGGSLDCTAEEAISEHIIDVDFKSEQAMKCFEVYPPMLQEGFWEKVKHQNLVPEFIPLRELVNY